MNFVDDLDGEGRGALLGAHLHQLAVFLLRLDEQRAFGGVVAAGLFNVDVLARLQAGDGHGRMPVVGRGDGDGVYILEFQDLAEVLSVAGA